MNELTQIGTIIDELTSVSEWISSDAKALSETLKQTIAQIMQNKDIVTDKDDSCPSCSSMKVAIKLLVNAVLLQAKQTQTFEWKLMERESQITSQTKALKEMKKELYTDSLTQVPNRAKYEVDFEQRIKDFKENGELLSYSLLDIDFFKKVNDTYGHKIWDAVLRKFASEIVTLLEKSEHKDSVSLYRIGWEEFVIMWAVTKRELFNLLEEIRAFFNEVNYIVNKSIEPQRKLKIAFSAWVSQFTVNSSAQSIYEWTDALLYKSKHNGRNQTTIEDEMAPVEIEKV